MKNKDIANLREEVNDLENRLQVKVNELKTTKGQLQIVQSRYEESLEELDQLQSKQVRKAEQIQRDVQDNYEKHINNVKMENLHLKETLREIHTAQTHQKLQSFGRPPTGEMNSEMQDEEQDEDELIAHFNDFDMAELGQHLGSPMLP